VRPVSCSFTEYEFCTNFRRGLLQRGDELEFTSNLGYYSH